jgi:SAM-dependent methyltransferase
MDNRNYIKINAETFDRWVKNGWEWGIPITHEAFVNAKNDSWNMYLSGTKPVPREWFPPMEGKKVLGLASGGGQQMPLCAAQGALCTVLDFSDCQLASEKLVAEREGYTIDMIKADMTKPLPLGDNHFDLIIHPVSNCYVEGVQHIWNECFRVLKKGGVLLAGMDNGFSFLFDDESRLPLTVANKLPYNPLKDPELFEKGLKANEGVQFSHTTEEQVGGQLKAGFILTDLYEDCNRKGRGLLREYMPQYIVTRALKP